MSHDIIISCRISCDALGGYLLPGKGTLDFFFFALYRPNLDDLRPLKAKCGTFEHLWGSKTRFCTPVFFFFFFFFLKLLLPSCAVSTFFLLRVTYVAYQLNKNTNWKGRGQGQGGRNWEPTLAIGVVILALKKKKKLHLNSLSLFFHVGSLPPPTSCALSM